MIAPDDPKSTFPFDVCRAARIARDVRYDGLFFSGATTTKIYCRPICPGKPPLTPNTVFFHNSAQAEAAGFRPCLRCRPELSPGNLIRNAARWEVRRLLDGIHQGVPSQDLVQPHPENDQGFCEETTQWDFYRAVGTTLSDYEKTFQLGFAKILLTDTALPLPGVAAMVGFDNPRALLKALSGRYQRDPMAFRKPLPVETRPGLQSCALMLSYRTPLDWPGLLNYFQGRAIAGVERVEGPAYHRSFLLQRARGWLSLQAVPDHHVVRLEVHASDLSCLKQVVWRVRRMLDLDADPMALEAHFQKDPILGRAWRRHPGIRVPVAWDAFEFAVRAIVGQVVSVGVATTLMGRIAAAFSQELSLPAPLGPISMGIDKLFPDPASLQGADLRPCGLTRSKAAAIALLAREVANGRLDLQTAANLGDFISKCTALRGIGEWTAQTIAMRGLGDPDAFPAGDLGIVKALSAKGETLKPAHIRGMAHGWRPWRAYAAMLLWQMKTE